MLEKPSVSLYEYLVRLFGIPNIRTNGRIVTKLNLRCLPTHQTLEFLTWGRELRKFEY